MRIQLGLLVREQSEHAEKDEFEEAENIQELIEKVQGEVR